ncbi:MAG TPA: response regulator transcription factor [Flavobacterium sp.]|jgi:DNA-binding NarL/FixJ family response regulator
MISIALVDDHKMFLDGMISVLSGEEMFNILFVENDAQRALEKLDSHLPDIIISDISMPNMNGIEFIRKVKAKHPDVKILVVSMFDNMQSIKNIDGYLLKETDKEQLVEAIISIVVDNKQYFGKQINRMDTFAFKKSILTQREKQIIRLIAEENTTNDIAIKLTISHGTIETHRKNIFLKLQVKNIAGLIKKAIYLGIIK